MSDTCIPNAILNDQRYKDLQPRDRCLAVAVIGDLQLLGDGKLTDKQHRAGRNVGQARFDVLYEVFRAAGWWDRNSEDKIIRAGILAPQQCAEEDLTLDLGPEAVKRRDEAARKRDDRLLRRFMELMEPRLAAIERQLGLRAVRTQAAPTPDKAASNGGHSASQSTPQTGQTDPADRTKTITVPDGAAAASHARADAGDSNSNFDSNSNLKAEALRDSNLDSNRSPAGQNHASDRTKPAIEVVAAPETLFPPPNHMAPLPSAADVIAAFELMGFTPKQATESIAQKSIADLVAGIDCCQRGYWPNAINRKATLHNYVFGITGKDGSKTEFRLDPNYVRDHVQPLPNSQARQTAAIYSVDGDAAEVPPVRARPEHEFTAVVASKAGTPEAIHEAVNEAMAEMKDEEQAALQEEALGRLPSFERERYLDAQKRGTLDSKVNDHFRNSLDAVLYKLLLERDAGIGEQQATG